MLLTAGLPVKEELLTRLAVGHHGPMGARGAAAARLVARSSLGAHGSTTTLSPGVPGAQGRTVCSPFSSFPPEEERPP